MKRFFIIFLFFFQLNQSNATETNKLDLYGLDELVNFFFDDLTKELNLPYCKLLYLDEKKWKNCIGIKNHKKDSEEINVIEINSYKNLEGKSEGKAIHLDASLLPRTIQIGFGEKNNDSSIKEWIIFKITGDDELDDRILSFLRSSTVTYGEIGSTELILDIEHELKDLKVMNSNLNFIDLLKKKVKEKYIYELGSLADSIIIYNYTTPSRIVSIEELRRIEFSDLKEKKISKNKWCLYKAFRGYYDKEIKKNLINSNSYFLNLNHIVTYRGSFDFKDGCLQPVTGILFLHDPFFGIDSFGIDNISYLFNSNFKWSDKNFKRSDQYPAEYHFVNQKVIKIKAKDSEGNDNFEYECEDGLIFNFNESTLKTIDSLRDLTIEFEKSLNNTKCKITNTFVPSSFKYKVISETNNGLSNGYFVELKNGDKWQGLMPIYREDYTKRFSLNGEGFYKCVKKVINIAKIMEEYDEIKKSAVGNLNSCNDNKVIHGIWKNDKLIDVIKIYEKNETLPSGIIFQ